MMEKKKLLISFSGGRTSAYMTKWLLDNKQREYEMIVVFANTGKEREETLNFIACCQSNWKINVIWVEAMPRPGRKGTEFIEVDFYSASRNGEPFERVISKYGIPSVTMPSCTRELKRNAIRSYAKSIGWKDYYSAIGIRADEIDRISEAKDRDRLVYPLIQQGITKGDINGFWGKQGWDLQLEEHQGNCDGCFKKSFKKLMLLAKEDPKIFAWWDLMENKYGRYATKNQTGLLDKIKRGGKRVFYRGNRSAQDIINGNIPKSVRKLKSCTESCEPF